METKTNVPAVSPEVVAKLQDIAGRKGNRAAVPCVAGGRSGWPVPWLAVAVQPVAVAGGRRAGAGAGAGGATQTETECVATRPAIP